LQVGFRCFAKSPVAELRLLDDGPLAQGLYGV